MAEQGRVAADPQPAAAARAVAEAELGWTLDQLPVATLKGVGPKLLERLAALGILSVQDLLLHLPIRYEDRATLVAIGALRLGERALIEGRIRDTALGLGGRRSLKVWLCDDTGAEILLRFFHFSRQQAGALTAGLRLRCFGEVRQGPVSWEMVHPEYRIQGEQPAPPPARLTPLYPTTAGLQQATLRGLVDQALDLLATQVPRDCLPPALLDDPLFVEALAADLAVAPAAGVAAAGPQATLALPDLATALRLLHRPPLGSDVAALLERRHPAARRLLLEELMAHQASLRRLRAAHREVTAPRLIGSGTLRRRLLEALPFRLTPAQQRVSAEISADLAEPLPMQRLLQGDVGSGKTVVAALAALQAVESGYQAALMAPTELLAEQHHRSLLAWLAPLDLAPLWLAGRHKGADRERRLAAVAAGVSAAAVVVGTHALLQEAVRFARLGLVIVDEQHRFGVQQRLQLRAKGAVEGTAPHQLIMTATPIPRSLAMTLYADLDLSIIEGLPPGRQPVTTVAVPDGRREQVIARVAAACRQGRQAYWVCTLIDESEALSCQAAEETARQLAAALPGVTVGLVHGRLKAAERDAVMGDFAVGRVQLLVATTVIEVGVDVPNASLMIIENPERLGLAQLHQLRGRVGRGATDSHCLLLYHPPLSAVARERLALLRASTNGLEIAERDLAMRGAGEVLGTRQTGALQLRVADPARDQALLPLAQHLADRLLCEHPALVQPLIARWLGQREALGLV